MRKDRRHQLRLGGLELAAHDIALDQLGHLRAHHMRAQKLARRGVKDRLDHPLGLTQRNRLAVADEGEAADPHLVPRGLRLLLGQPDARDLRLAIGTARDRLCPHRMRMAARDQLRHHHPLVARLVRQPGRPGDIADGVKPRHPGAAECVRHHMRPLDPDPQRLEPEVLDIAHDPDRRNHGVEALSRDLARLFDMGDHAHPGRAVQLLDRRLLDDRHPLLDELLAGKGADLGILDRQDAVHHLHHRRLRAQRVEEAREFDPDRARPDDQKALGHPWRLQRMAIAPDQIAIRLEPRQHPRPRPRGQDHAPARDQVLGPLLARHRDTQRPGQPRAAHHHLDLVLLQKMADPVRQLLGHGARPLDHRAQVIADPRRTQPEFRRAVHEVKDLGRPQHRLGRNAAPVQADPAQVLALDHDRLEPQLRRPDRRDIAARPPADHDHVEFSGGHRSSSLGLLWRQLV